MSDKITMRGCIKAINTVTGEVVFEKHNNIVQVGLNELAKMVGGQTGSVPQYCAVGTSNAATTLADTALKGTELARKAFDSVSVSDGAVNYVTTFGPGVGTGVWEETGMFSAESEGIMWSRALTGTYTKGENDEIKVFWTYLFKDAVLSTGE